MITCDVTDDASVKKAVEEVLDTTGRIDVLVKNARDRPHTAELKSLQSRKPRRCLMQTLGQGEASSPATASMMLVSGVIEPVVVGH